MGAGASADNAMSPEELARVHAMLAMSPEERAREKQCVRKERKEVRWPKNSPAPRYPTNFAFGTTPPIFRPDAVRVESRTLKIPRSIIFRFCQTAPAALAQGSDDDRVKEPAFLAPTLLRVGRASTPRGEVEISGASAP